MVAAGFRALADEGFEFEFESFASETDVGDTLSLCVSLADVALVFDVA